MTPWAIPPGHGGSLRCLSLLPASFWPSHPSALEPGHRDSWRPPFFLLSHAPLECPTESRVAPPHGRSPHPGQHLPLPPWPWPPLPWTPQSRTRRGQHEERLPAPLTQTLPHLQNAHEPCIPLQGPMILSGPLPSFSPPHSLHVRPRNAALEAPGCTFGVQCLSRGWFYLYLLMNKSTQVWPSGGHSQLRVVFQGAAPSR